MSTDYTAYTIIGIKIPEEELHTTVKKRGCKHPETNTKCCPECGAQMWITTKEDIPEYESGSEKFMNLKAIKGTDDTDLYVGEIFETGNSNGGNDEAFNKIPETETLKNKIKTKLGKYWNEKRFGIYTILYCSY